MRRSRRVERNAGDKAEAKRGAGLEGLQKFLMQGFSWHWEFFFFKQAHLFCIHVSVVLGK